MNNHKYIKMFVAFFMSVIGIVITAQIIVASVYLTVIFFIVFGILAITGTYYGCRTLNILFNSAMSEFQRRTEENRIRAQFSVISAGGRDIIADRSGNMIDTVMLEDAYFDMQSPNVDNPNALEKWAIRQKIKSNRVTEAPAKKLDALLDRITDTGSGNYGGNTETVTPVNSVLSRLTAQVNTDITESRLPSILDKMVSSGAVLVNGSSGTGKTTLLGKLIDEISDNTHVSIFDPHAHKGKYPEGVQVISGKDCKDIEKAMINAIQMCDEIYDYESYTGNPDDYPAISIIIDEFTKLNRKIPETLSNFMSEASEDFRKANVNIYIFTHSDDVSTMGVKGKSGVLGYFDKVKLLGENGNFDAVFTPKGTKEKIRCRVPYDGMCQHDNAQRADMPACASMSDEENAVLTRFDNDISKNQIQREVFGQRSPKYLNIVNDILRKNGRIS